MPKKLNMIKRRFGRLVVLSENGRAKCGKIKYLCLCDCGNKKTIIAGDLTSGKTKSCGCLHKEIVKNLCGEKHPSYIDGRKYDKEYKRKYNTKYYKENKDKIKTYMKKNKNKISAKKAERRAKKLNQTPILTENEKRKVSLYYQIAIYLGEDFHVDHIQPLSKGGLHHPDNLQVLDAKLNLQKHNKWPLTEAEKIKYKGIRI